MARKLPDKIRVTVTRNMIHWAVTQSSTQCAVALALRDADPDGLFERPFVSQDRIAFTDRYTDLRYSWFADWIPEKLKSWLDQFDRDPSKCRPFSFTVDTTVAKVEQLKRRKSPEDVVRQQKYNRSFEAKYPDRKSGETVAQVEERRQAAQVEERRQAKIPVAQREGIRHTSKRELRNVLVPADAGVI